MKILATGHDGHIGAIPLPMLLDRVHDRASTASGIVTVRDPRPTCRKGRAQLLDRNIAV